VTMYEMENPHHLGELKNECAGPVRLSNLIIAWCFATVLCTVALSFAKRV
jgi:hypothetical protein